MTRRVPALDGVRGIAIALVLIGHSVPLPLRLGGPAGVAVFFTLSGFLIGTLLLDERDQGGIRVGAFYLRRARRLLPALAVLLAVLLVIEGITWVQAIPPAFYFQNLVGGTSLVAHTWSLSIEEQFYLAFPAALILLSRKFTDRGLAWLFGSAMLASVTWRVVLIATGESERAYYDTGANACLLLAGVTLALLAHHIERSHRTIGALAVVGLCSLLLIPKSPDAVAWAPLAAASLTAALIASTLQGAPRWLTNRPLVLLGQRSYGLYLWHWPPILLLAPTRGPMMPVALAIGFGATWLSWRYVETPFLRSADRHRGDTARVPSDRHRPSRRGLVAIEVDIADQR